MSLLPTSPSRKRPLPTEDLHSHAVTPVKSNNGSSGDSVAQSTPLSSVPSVDSITPSKSGTSTQPTSAVAIPAVGDTSKPPQKRRKLTPQEKEQQRQEREAKDKGREEKKALKEAEREAKEAVQKEKKEKQDEEKRIKDEASKVKKEQQEERRRLKELEQAKREEEKAKKERSQMKLGAFFGKPVVASDKTASTTKSPMRAVSDEQRRKSISLEPEQGTIASRAASPSLRAPTKSKRSFLPFELPTNASMPASYTHQLSAEEQLARCAKLDQSIEITRVQDVKPSQLLKELQDRSTMSLSVGTDVPSVSKLMELMAGSVANPVDLTVDESSLGSGEEALAWLQRVPVKFLRFHEDVRPPYCGTFSKPISSVLARKLARNSIKPDLPDMNYDYDSEAEWEEPEEGEDLDSDGEEDVESNGDADEMDGFLDDEDDISNKRRLLTSDLEPISTGLVWEDARGIARSHDGVVHIELSEYKLGFLLDASPRSIDPFSTAYWASESIPPPSSFVNQMSAGAGAMQPPRMPLSMTKGANIPMQSGPLAKAVEGKRMVPPQCLAEFKMEIAGSDMTKIAMVEALKKKFPKFPKDMITNTLNTVAKRVGSGHEKVWQLT